MNQSGAHRRHCRGQSHRGGAGKDSLGGGLGDDTIFGGLGNDVLTRQCGKDIFAFNTKTNKSTQCRQIADFVVKDDSIWLDNAVFTKIGKGTEAQPGKLTKAMFWAGKAAHDASDRIVYDKASGALYYDADGTGRSAQVKIATLKKGHKPWTRRTSSHLTRAATQTKTRRSSRRVFHSCGRLLPFEPDLSPASRESGRGRSGRRRSDAGGRRRDRRLSPAPRAPAAACCRCWPARPHRRRPS